MRKIFILSAGLVTCALVAMTARAQDYGFSSSAGYNIERWDEDWSYLKDPARRSDLFDPVKYVPFNDSGNSYASFGGQARYRYDYFNNSNFGAGPEDNDGFHLTRLLTHADIHFCPNFRAFVQINSG